MLAIIIIYVLFLMVVGIRDSFKVKSFNDFAVAGKRQSFFPVYMSLLATVLGASSTIGVADKVSQIGFPAFWWLGVGAIGLILQALFLSKKVRGLDANTLPDVAHKTVGSGAKSLIAFIIAVAWIGVIAAQFISMARIISLMLPDLNPEVLLASIAIIVILYTVFGGQFSVLRTDVIQTSIIFVGMLATFIYVFFGTQVAGSSVNEIANGAATAVVNSAVNSTGIFNNIALVNDKFGTYDIFYMLFVVGGAYFLGPDIMSRNFVSKDGNVAKRGAIAAAITLVVFSAVITLVSLWGVNNIHDLNGANPLLYIMNNVVPYPLAILLCISLVSALLSSADTCLVNAASIIEYDILKSDNIKRVRGFVLLLGAAALGVALFKKDIIGLLTSVYSIYVPGIVCPLAVAIFAYKKRPLFKPLWFAAVIMGGALGFLKTVLGVGPSSLPLIAMGLSLVVSLASVLLPPKGNANAEA